MNLCLKKRSTSRIYGLDILKSICTFMVIMIHTGYPGELGNYAIVLSRIAVPIFFMITGFFYVESNDNKKLKKLKAIALLAIKAMIFYMIIDLLKCIINKKNIYLYINEVFNIKKIAKFFLFNEPISGFHLWYLFAILYCLAIIYILNKIIHNRIEQLLIIFTPVLLLISLIFGKYSLAFLGVDIPIICVRNFAFDAIPFFSIGFIIRKWNIVDRTRDCKIRYMLIVAILFAVLNCLENYLLRLYNVNATRESYISTIFLAISVFIIFTNNYWNGKFKLFYIIGKEYTLYIYIIHIIILDCIWNLIKYMPGQTYSITQYLIPIIVFVLSIIVSIIIKKIKYIISNMIKEI